jgi:hypothetical protein
MRSSWETTMLRSGRSLRLTATEIEELQALGIDVSSVKCAGDFAAALDPWLHALADVRPDLFRKIGDKIAAAKGMQLPPESGPDRQ